jgi:hypothetical protein
MRTKWEILQARRAELADELAKLDQYMRGLEGQPCMLRCNKCDKLHNSEADFAKHYLIPDERYLNLGHCPTNTSVTAIP